MSCRGIEFDDFLDELGEGDARVTGLLRAILLNTRSGSPLFYENRKAVYFDPVSASSNLEDVLFLRNWLKAAIGCEERWIERLDYHGLPHRLHGKKFTEVMALAQTETSARRVALRHEFSRYAAPCLDQMIDQGHCRIECEFASGRKLVEMLTPHALDWESIQMRNCIGYGGYDVNLERGSRYFSLRDAKNLPHVTMEVHGGVVLQCRGKEDKPPVSKYMEEIKDVIRANRWGLHPKASRTGLICADGRLHEMMDLPRDFEWEGDLDFTGANFLTSLPKELKVSGNFRLSCAQAVALPSVVNIGGDMSVEDCENLAYGAESLTVDGHLRIASCPKLRLVTRYGTVSRALTLQATGVKNLWNLHVSGGIRDDRGIYRSSWEFNRECRYG